jgi:hypothetical protein
MKLRTPHSALRIFHRPIGTLRDLGTAPIWIGEIVCGVIIVIVVIAALIFL